MYVCVSEREKTALRLLLTIVMTISDELFVSANTTL